MKRKAPINALTLTGAEIYTAKAMQTLQVQYVASGRGSQEEIHNGLSQLQN